MEAENHDGRNDEKNRERDRSRDCRKCVDRPVNLQCSSLRRVSHGRALWCLPDPVPVVRASYGCDESGAKYSGSSALLAADWYEIYPEIPSMHAHFLDYAGLRGSVISGLRRKPDGGSHYDWRHRWNRLWADLYQWLFYRRCGFYHHGGESLEPSCEAGKYYIWH